MAFYQMTFSPTGGTDLVARFLSAAFEDDVKRIDLFFNAQKGETFAFQREDVCLIAVPAFGGRVPDLAVKQLQGMKGGGARAILVAVFGNRHIDDTLIELYDVTKAAGFTPVAGVEAVAEHSIMRQFGHGRPDAEDKKELISFSARLKEEIGKGIWEKELVLPGNRPYRTYNGVPFRPIVNTDECKFCGICARGCPVGAIPMTNPSTTDVNACIACMHCISSCPWEARSLSPELLRTVSEKNAPRFAGRKENKLYL